MNKIVSLLAITLMALCASHSLAQCASCSSGVNPSFGQPVYNSMPMQTSYAPMQSYAQPAVTTTGCSSCGSGAVTNYAPTMNYAPTTTMNYAPATMNYSSVPQSTIAQPTVVTQPTTVVSGGSSYVGGTSYTPAVSTCNNCPPQRGGRLRGRIFRNR